MRRRCFHAALFLALGVAPGGGSFALAQEAPLPLHIKKTVRLSGERAAIMMVPLKCDAEGNIYIRGYLADNVMAAPVVRFSPDGQRRTAFDLRAAPGFEQGGVSDYAVGLRGDLFLLAYKTVTQRSIVRFHKDGSFDRALDLEPGFDPSRIAVFPSGEFLVSGLRFSQQDLTLPGQPFEAIFDRWGKLLSTLKLPDDVQRNEVGSEEQQPGGKQVNLAPQDMQDEVASAISLGSAVTADDGNVYLMRAAAQPLIFVVALNGEVVRRLQLDPPSRDHRAVTMKVAGGRIAIQSEEENPAEGAQPSRMITLFDAISGMRFADYLSPQGVGGAFACYRPSGFTFVGSDEQLNLVIHEVSP